MLTLAGAISVLAVMTSIPVGATHTTGSSGDHTHLPVGGAPSSTPAVGTVYACQTTFGGGGAAATGTWFNGDGTFDLTKKPVVDGDVSWPDAKLKVTRKGSKRIITGNDLPVKHTTGTFPVGSTDDAFQFDPNPNSIRGQTVDVTLPAGPKVAAQPSCTSGGPIGIMLSGVQIFNALDAGGRDAVAYELQDHCNGHPQQQGAYHYHSLSECVAETDSGTGHSKLLGYVYDGFGIYGTRGEKGKVLTNADLDECHGHTHTVKWNGKKAKMYHYHATAAYPYTIGCYRGTPAVTQPGGGAGGPPGGPPPGAAPPAGP
jgi:YHYH protein